MQMDVDEPPKYGLGTTPVWGFSGDLLEKVSTNCKNRQNRIKVAFGVAWVCPSMGIMWRPLEKVLFFAKKKNFLCRCANLLQITKSNVFVFFLFPYFGISRSLA